MLYYRQLNQSGIDPAHPPRGEVIVNGVPPAMGRDAAAACLAAAGAALCAVVAAILVRRAFRRAGAARALAASEKNYRTLVEKSDSGIMIAVNGVVAFANVKMCGLAGRRSAEMAGKRCVEVLGGEMAERIADGGAGAVPRLRCETVVVSRDRRTTPVEAVVSRIEYAGAPACMVTVTDIGARRRAERERLRLASFPETHPHPIVELSPDGAVIYLNRAASRLFPDLKDRGLSHPYLVDVPLKPEEFAAGRGRMVQREVAVGRTWFEQSVYYVADVPSVRIYGYDVTERKKAEEQITYLTFHDKVTGLYNRTYFEEELRRLDTERELPISLIMGDVNNLKLVNDAFGHREGDKLLLRIAAILKSSCRDGDIVARWGGDEFVILLPRAAYGVAADIARRIRRCCGESKRGLVQPTIALGIASKDEANHNINAILKKAEDRMYRTKLIENKSGRSAIISSFVKTLRERSHETGQHTQRLRKLVLEVGRALQLPDSQLDELSLLAALHDIGKIGIPDDILLKPGPLSAKEWRVMLKHSEIGYRIAQSFGALAPIADAILAHHERWDGSGYPQGLKRDAVPLISRILAIVDAYDVMVHGRPYQRPVSHLKALDELKRHAGTQFDPELVTVFADKALFAALPD